MFSKLAFFVAATLAVFVAAAPTTSGGDIDNSCNAENVQCCNQVLDNNSDNAALLYSILGVDVSNVDGQIGTTCSPFTIGGVGEGSSCDAQPVCCSNNSFNGLIAIGCTPININV